MGINGLSEKDIKDLTDLYAFYNKKRAEIDPQTAGLILFEMMLRRCHEFGYEIDLKSVSTDGTIFDKSYISKDTTGSFVYVGFDCGDNIDHTPMIAVYDSEKFVSIDFTFDGYYGDLNSCYYSKEEMKKRIDYIQSKIEEAFSISNKEQVQKNR